MLAEFAERFTGSSDLYKNDSRRPTASINFVTAHDGFTLQDLVSYNEKHNMANGENNNDGESNNHSWNCGVEGPTDDLVVLELRQRQKRNFLTTLFLSQGVPMLLSGDELGRTQQGNNNAYCQDNEISWINWKTADKDLLEFTKKIIQLRKKHPVFRRRRWFQGLPIKGVGLEDIAWFLPDGSEMTEEHWNVDFAKSLAIFMNGQGIHSIGSKGEHVKDDSFYIIFNAFHEPLSFKLPTRQYGSNWTKELDTYEVNFEPATYKARESIKVEGRSIMLLRSKVKVATGSTTKVPKGMVKTEA